MSIASYGRDSNVGGREEARFQYEHLEATRVNLAVWFAKKFNHVPRRWTKKKGFTAVTTPIAAATTLPTP